jgi:adenine-specific DNA-methyltransferase
MNGTQPQLLQIALDKKDVVYTPDWVARDMVDFFKPTGRILEPACGDGAILKYLPGA